METETLNNAGPASSSDLDQPHVRRPSFASPKPEIPTETLDNSFQQYPAERFDSQETSEYETGIDTLLPGTVAAWHELARAVQRDGGDSVALLHKVWRGLCDDLAQDGITLTVGGQPDDTTSTSSSRKPGSSSSGQSQGSSSSSHRNLSSYDSSAAAAAARREMFQQDFLGAIPVMVAVGCVFFLCRLGCKGTEGQWILTCDTVQV